MTRANDTAFPIDGILGCENVGGLLGLTKREYIATQLLAALSANPSLHLETLTPWEVAVKRTDALISELNKDK